MNIISCPNPPTNIKVMSFNIRYDTESDGIYRWDNRKEFVLDVIKNFSPDLLGIQEAMMSQVNYLKLNLSDYYGFGIKTAENIDQQDSLLFVKKDRFNIVDEKHFWMSKTPEVPYSNNFDKPMFSAPYNRRTISCVTLFDKINHNEIFFCNTHWNGEPRWTDQASELTKRIFEKFGKDTNILVGDFNAFPFSYNSWPTSPEWIVGFRGQAYDMLTSFLVDGFKKLNPNNTQPSGCGWASDCPEFDNDYRVDWILHSKNLITCKSEILIERRNGVPASDHFPVISVLNYSFLDN